MVKKSKTKKKEPKKKYPDGDDFDKKYTLSKIKSENFEGPGQLETFGKDIETVLKINKKTPKRVWTAVDGEEGIWWIAGYHLVNRIYYIITEEEWADEFEEYLDFENSEEES